MPDSDGKGAANAAVVKIIQKLKSLANPKNVEGMARFGINANTTLGIPVPTLRAMAKELGKNQQLSLELWQSGIHEACLLAGFIGDPKQVNEAQMEEWVKDFDSWDVCDQVCMNLFDKTPFAHAKAVEWSGRKDDFVKRAGFAMMATLAVHDKKAGDEEFLRFIPIIELEVTDERNFVRKAVNWALRQIGKRNKALNKKAIESAERILGQNPDSKSAKWIAKDALRELKSEQTQKRLVDRSQTNSRLK